MQKSIKCAGHADLVGLVGLALPFGLQRGEPSVETVPLFGERGDQYSLMLLADVGVSGQTRIGDRMSGRNDVQKRRDVQNCFNTHARLKFIDDVL